MPWARLKDQQQEGSKAFQVRRKLLALPTCGNRTLCGEAQDVVKPAENVFAGDPEANRLAAYAASTASSTRPCCLSQFTPPCWVCSGTYLNNCTVSDSRHGSEGSSGGMTISTSTAIT